MLDSKRISKLAGWCAVVSSLLFVASLKTPDPISNGLTVAWNILLLPGAVVLWAWLRGRSRWVDAASACGIAATLLWAAAPVTRWWRLEAVWIGLAMLWWLGIGIAVRPLWKWFGWASLILAGAALLDLIVTAVATFGSEWYFLGAVKLPLSMVWSLWLGVLLVTRPVEVGLGRG